MNCIFCEKSNNEVLFENEFAKAFYDNFPVNKGHILIVPKDHKENFFDLTDLEKSAINGLLTRSKLYLEKRYNAEGFNIGWNCGKIAGQTIFHAHCHLIPRYANDIEGDPKGGIRNFKKPLIEY